jgi:hypothetical protein
VIIKTPIWLLLPASAVDDFPGNSLHYIDPPCIALCWNPVFNSWPIYMEVVEDHSHYHAMPNCLVSLNTDLKRVMETCITRLLWSMPKQKTYDLVTSHRVIAVLQPIGRRRTSSFKIRIRWSHRDPSENQLATNHKRPLSLSTWYYPHHNRYIGSDWFIWSGKSYSRGIITYGNEKTPRCSNEDFRSCRLCPAAFPPKVCANLHIHQINNLESMYV